MRELEYKQGLNIIIEQPTKLAVRERGARDDYCP